MTEGTGFITRPGMVVNEIKNLLKGRYKRGFPVIKEIIQNANDGRASHLDFGVIRGLASQIEHPLLKCPALFFLNNGSFTRTDQQAITWFAVDANAGDKSKIGKFGLGQKSVFHFCEAFFYIARSDDIPDGCGRLLNPWAPATGVDPKRPDWVSLSDSDRQSLERYMISQGLLEKNNPRYFLLWIPLRQEAPDKRYILSDRYDADSVQADLPKDMDLQIAQLLPSLRHLIQVRYWVQQGNYTLDEKFQICLQSLEHEPLARCRYPKNHQESEETSIPSPYDLRGKTSINPGGIQLQFGGQEHLLPFSYFTSLLEDGSSHRQEEFWRALEQSDHWAKRRSYDENGDDHDEPDKVLPHCAALFTRRKLNAGERGRFTLQWAVFLPLAGRDQENQEEFFEYPCDGNYDYTLLLHGYFFLDSGRQYVEALGNILTDLQPKLPKSEEEMNQQWNRILATQGTLRLILPALKVFAASHQLQSSDTSNICKAFKKSNCYKKSNRQHLCADYQWFYRLHPQKDEWTLLDTQVEVRSLPAAPPDWNVFPILKQMADHAYLTLVDSPNLRIERPEDQWTTNEVIQVLAFLDAKVIFSSSQHLRFLVDFLISTSVFQEATVQEALHKLIIQGFRAVGIQTLQQVDTLKLVQTCIGLLAPEKRFKVKRIQGIEDGETSTILQEMLTLNLPKLLIYEPFEPGKSLSSDCLEDYSANLILQYFERLFQSSSQNQQRIADNIIEQILTPESTPRLLSANPTLQVIRGYDCSQNEYQTYSYKELVELYQRNSLYSSPGRLLSSNNLIKALQEAIANHRLVLISASKTNLFSKDPILRTILRWDIEGFRKLIGTCPSLNASQHRINLVSELLPVKAIKELRYLLHGNKAKYNDASTKLFIIAGNQISSSSDRVWEKIGRQVLAKTGESWRLIDRALANRISSDIQSILGIALLTAERVVELIEEDFKKQGADCVDTTEWSDLEYNILLLQLHSGNKLTLWKELRIHKAENNQRVSIIDNQTYLKIQSKYSDSFVNPLPKIINLIQVNSDSRIERAQREWIQHWTPQAAIHILLSQPSPQQYCSQIMATLEESIPLWRTLPPQEVEPLEAQLRTTAWLSTKVGNQGICPTDVVKLPKNLAKYETNILALEIGYSEAALASSIRKHNTAYQWLSSQFKSYSSLDILSLILEKV